MRIDWWTLALQAVNVLILVWLLGRFLFRPVMDAIAARRASARALLDEAREAKDRAQAEAQALKTQNDGFVADAAARRAEIRTEAEAERQRLLAQARLEADAVVEQGHAAIDAERGRVAAQWREKAASLAASMAGTLLARLPPEQTVQAMVDALKARLGDLSEADRLSGGRRARHRRDARAADGRSADAGSARAWRNPAGYRDPDFRGRSRSHRRRGASHAPRRRAQQLARRSRRHGGEPQ